ncbi:MAG: hypothetical protein K8F59_14945 [Rhodobacteraceae bacterium]|nr:hypothetical protein [Paracoccaceae bacterium]
MSLDETCPLPAGRCADQGFRLAVYEAGHALTARALGLRVLSVRMLPRPPVLVSDKTFVANNWSSFTDTLENRIIELFGGQIAEQHACASNTCCSGDVARIDELARLVAGLDGERESDDIYFDLEDMAQDIFADPRYRAAILPMAEFLYDRVQNGHSVIAGEDVEAELDKHLPKLAKAKWARGLFSFGRRKV